MDNRFARLGLAGVAASLVTAQPAQAADCWSAEQAAAARIKDFQSRLMVATLRCNAMGLDRSSNYNGFVIANKPAISGAIAALKARFEQAYGAQWMREYDRYNTALANAYGADATNQQVCDDLGRLADDAIAADGNREKLLAVAERAGGSPRLPGGVCEGGMASL